MNKAIQALLTGMFITFILDFFLFLGLLLNYIEYYKIDLFFNILFADNQNGYLFFGISIVFGFIIVYINSYKLSLTIIAILSFAVLLTLFEGIGRNVGEAMLMTKNTTLKTAKHLYVGDIIYDGREAVTFYDYNLKKTITLNKKDLTK